jgi:hypothetical protein
MGFQERQGSVGKLRKMEVEETVEVEGGREDNNNWSKRKGRGEESWGELKEYGGRRSQGREQ